MALIAQNMVAGSQSRLTHRKLITSFLLSVFLGVLIVGLKVSFGRYSTTFVLLSIVLVVAFCLFLFAYNLTFVLALCVAFMPFTRGLFQFELGIVTFSPFTIGVIVLITLVILKQILKPETIRFGFLDINVLMIGVYFLVSTLLADDKILVGHAAFHALFIPICTYFLLRLAIRTDVESNVVIGGMIVGSTIFALVHVLMMATTGARVMILGVPAISIASLMIFPIIFLMVAGVPGYTKGLISGVPVLVSLLLSFSRMYLAGIISSIFLYRFIRAGRGTILLMLLMLTSLIATLILTMGADLGKKTFFGRTVIVGQQQKSKMREAENSAARLTSGANLIQALYGRAATQQYALKRFLEHPVFGTGIKPKELGMATQHNFHIEWLQYGGIVGYIIYAGIFLGFFRRTDRLSKHDKVTAAIQLSVILLLVNSVTNGVMHGYMPTIIFTLMGLARSRQVALQKRWS